MCPDTTVDEWILISRKNLPPRVNTFRQKKGKSSAKNSILHFDSSKFF